jgi:hypothetical protein
LEEVPLGFYHVPLRNEFNKLVDEAMNKVADSAGLKLSMRSGFLYGKANANLLNVIPVEWPPNGFLHTAMEGTRLHNCCTKTSVRQ